MYPIIKGGKKWWAVGVACPPSRIQKGLLCSTEAEIAKVGKEMRLFRDIGFTLASLLSLLAMPWRRFAVTTSRFNARASLRQASLAWGLFRLRIVKHKNKRPATHLELIQSVHKSQP